MTRKSRKIDKDRGQACAYEIFDVMRKYEENMTFIELVHMMAGVLYSNIAVWYDIYPKDVVETALRAFAEFMHPEPQSEKEKELETLLKKHFV